MSTLFAALSNSSQALDVLEQAIGTVQSNVANASTPGYVTQSLDISTTLTGGLEAGDLQSARDSFAEQSVWTASQQAGMAKEQATNLQALQSLFNVSGTSGIPGALSSLYSAFSAWSNSPNDATARQQVIAAAAGVSQAFNATGAGIDQLRSQANQSTGSVVNQINSLTAQIAGANSEIRKGAGKNPGLDAQLYNNLEQLSGLADIAVRKETDGTVTVLLGGQAPLILGETQTALQVKNVTPSASTYPNGATDAHILTASGQDLTGFVTQGQLGALLNFTNQTLPSIAGDGQQQGSLNRLAQAVADRVNTLLTSGQTSSGTPGVPLFSYNAALPTSIASTLSVNSSLTASQLAPVDPGPPSAANGIASKLAQLSSPQASTDMLDDVSYTDFYSGIAANTGSLAAAAQTAETTQAQLLTQAQSLRAQSSGISLNAQAAQLLEFQQSYQAAAHVLATISSTIQYFLQTVQQLQ